MCCLVCGTLRVPLFGLQVPRICSCRDIYDTFLPVLNPSPKGLTRLIGWEFVEPVSPFVPVAKSAAVALVLFSVCVCLCSFFSWAWWRPGYRATTGWNAQRKVTHDTSAFFPSWLIFFSHLSRVCPSRSFIRFVVSRDRWFLCRLRTTPRSDFLHLWSPPPTKISYPLFEVAFFLPVPAQ